MGFFHVAYHVPCDELWVGEGTQCVMLCDQEERATASDQNMKMSKCQELITPFNSSDFVTGWQLEGFPTPWDPLTLRHTQGESGSYCQKQATKLFPNHCL